MIVEQPYSDVREDDGSHRRVIVPVWLRVPGHCDLGEVGDDDIVAECRRRGYLVFPVGRDLDIGNLRVYADRSAALRGGTMVRLSPLQAEVLRRLAGAYPRALTYPRIALLCWGDATRVPEARVYVTDLRRKLPGLIRSLRTGARGGIVSLVLTPDAGEENTA
jgi:hypothetical protein